MSIPNSTENPAAVAAKAAPAPTNPLTGHELLRDLLRADACDRWGIPARGEYGGGCMTGRAAARAYLKVLRSSRDMRRYGGCLQGIAMSMLSDRSTDHLDGSSSSVSRRGQAVGFFAEIDRVLIQCVGLLGCLDSETFEALGGQIDEGLAWTKADEKRRRVA